MANAPEPWQQNIFVTDPTDPDASGDCITCWFVRKDAKCKSLLFKISRLSSSSYFCSVQQPSMSRNGQWALIQCQGPGPSITIVTRVDRYR